jgi:hypothetical protein
MTPVVDYFTLIAAATRTVLTAPWPQNWRRFKWLFIFAIIWPLLRGSIVFFLLLDHVLYPGFRKQKIIKPLFIVGNMRTGSTLMYRTLAEDTKHFACFRMLDAFMPAISMMRAVAFLGRVDAKLGGYGARVVQYLDEAFLDEYSRIHDIGFLKPEEDEFALLNYMCSASMYELFPAVQRFRRLFFVDQEMGPKEQDRVMRRYLSLVKRQLFHLGGDKRFLSKNPLFTNKLKALRRTFPDARFVCLVRHPVNTVLSTASLIHFVWHQSGALPPDQKDMGKILEFCRCFYSHPRECLHDLGPEQTCVMRYDELVADPGGVMRDMLERFELPVSEELDEILREIGTKQKQYRSQHSYSFDAWGVTESEIYEQFRDVYTEHNFARPEAATATVPNHAVKADGATAG